MTVCILLTVHFKVFFFSKRENNKMHNIAKKRAVIAGFAAVGWYLAP